MADEELFAMTEDELFGDLAVALRGESKAIANELASFAHTVPDRAQTAVLIEQGRQRQLALEEELRRRG
jgi:hypothetical protein